MEIQPYVILAFVVTLTVGLGTLALFLVLLGKGVWAYIKATYNRIKTIGG